MNSLLLDLVAVEEAKATCPRLTLVSVGQCRRTVGLRNVIGQLVLLQMLVFTSEGCAKSQSYEASTPMEGLLHSTTTAALPRTSRPTTPSASHRQPCSAKQIGLAGCLNGGSCFTVDQHNTSSPTAAHCSCTSNWSGDRCEYRYIDPDDWAIHEAQERLKKIYIAIGIGTAVLVVIILISVALYQRKRLTRANPSTVSGNSTTGTNNCQTASDTLMTHEEEKQDLNRKCIV